MSGKILVALLGLALALASGHAWAATAHLNASEILEFETIELVLRGSHNQNPDVSLLQQDFEVLNRSSQSSIQFVNGELQVTENIVTVNLRPKRTGLIHIPAISFGDEFTQALELVVKPIDAEVQREIDKKAYLEVEVSDSTPHQGEAVFITRRLFYAPNVQIYGGLPATPEVSNAIVQPLGEPRSDTRTIDGQRYGLIETEYVLFADQPGPLTIPVAEVMASMQIPSYSRGRPTGVPIRSREISLDVLAPPATYPASQPWLAAQGLRVSSLFETVQASLGEPMTFDVRIAADGALASQIAPLDLVFPSSIKSYAESPRLEDHSQKGSVRGERIERYSLIPTQIGVFTLPEVRITWWDTQQERVRESHLAAREIEILPNPNLANQPIEMQSRSPESSGQISSGSSSQLVPDRRSVFDWLDLVLLLACFALAAGWFRNSVRGRTLRSWINLRRTVRSPEQLAFDDLCQSKELASAVAAFRVWLAFLPKEFTSQASTQLRQAEATLYAPQAPKTAPTISDLHQTAKRLRRIWQEETKLRSKLNTLPGLYQRGSGPTRQPTSRPTQEPA